MAERFLLGAAHRLHWPLPDPDRRDEALDDAQRLAYFRETRDELQRRIAALGATAGVT